MAMALAMPGAARAAAPIEDVPAAFEEIPAEAAVLMFDPGEPRFPPGGHLQGIQARCDAAAKRQLVFLSHDSASAAYLVVVAFGEDLASAGRVIHVLTFPGDGRSPPLRHAGGIQLVDNLLVVGLEDNQEKTRSEIRFWDVAKAEQPGQLTHLTIRRSGEPKEMTAGAVGIARRERDYLLAVANWDSRAVDFYTSSGAALDDPACRFERRVRWREELAAKEDWRPDREFGAYQAINLVGDSGGKLYLVGLQTADEKDVADLFAIHMNGDSSRLVRKVARKEMRLPEGNHFRYAGGIWLRERGLAILSSPRSFSRPTRLGMAR
jgi:hypothetical protein